MFTFRHFAVLCGIVSALGTQPAHAAEFSIKLNFVSAFTTSQRNIITAAANYWDSAILDYKPGVTTLDGIDISVRSVTNDGVGGGLAAAGFTSSALRSGTRYATAGVLLFDEADVGVLESRNKLIDVAIHEIAHALGFGTLWVANGLYDASTGVVNTAISGKYTGAAGLAAYQSEYDPMATFVPVEKNFGTGTADAHWDESWAGGSAALMTGRLNIGVGGPTSYITQTTIASFNDLGYQVALNKAMSAADVPTIVPLPPAATLLLASVVSLGALRRRKAA